MGLYDAVSQYASGDFLISLGAATGESEERLRTAMSGAVPAVLLILTDRCATPGGADVVFGSLDPRGPSMLDRLPSAFESDSAHLLIETGYRHLTTIASRPAADDLVHALGRYAGIGHDASHSIVGLASCITLSAIARDLAPGNPHALASWLNDEKPTVLAAMPPALNTQLDTIPSLRSLSHQYDSGSPATSTDDDMRDEAEMPRQENFHNERYYKVDQSAGLPQEIAWLIPILVVAAIISLTVFFLHPRNEAARVTTSPPPSVEDRAIPAGGALAADVGPTDLASNQDLATELTTLLDTLTNDLSQHQNAAERQKALAADLLKLQELSPRIAKLPPAEQRAVADLVNKRLPTIETMSSSAPLDQDPLSRQTATEIRRQLRSFAQEPL